MFSRDAIYATTSRILSVAPMLVVGGRGEIAYVHDSFHSLFTISLLYIYIYIYIYIDALTRHQDSNVYYKMAHRQHIAALLDEIAHGAARTYD